MFQFFSAAGYIVNARRFRLSATKTLWTNKCSVVVAAANISDLYLLLQFAVVLHIPEDCAMKQSV